MSKYKFPLREDVLQIRAILDAAASVWGLHPKNILGRSRRQPEAIVRQICMVLSYRMTSLTMAQIAQAFRRADHTIVVHAVKAVDKAIKKEEIAQKISQIIRKAPPRHMRQTEKAEGEGGASAENDAVHKA